MVRQWGYPISSFRECLDYQTLIVISPSPHLCIRVNDRGEIIDNISLLSTFVMKGHSARCQRSEGTADVDLGTRLVEFMDLLEYDENRAGGLASLELGCEGMGKKIVLCVISVGFQGITEY